MTIQELAQQALSSFTRQEREHKRSLVILKDDAPDWVDDLVDTAHGQMLADDWRYELIEDALGAIATDDVFDIDSLYPYTHDRLDWLSSRLDRLEYCDDAIDEFGLEVKQVEVAIVYGMVRELEEVNGLVMGCLEERLSELEEAETESV